MKMNVLKSVIGFVIPLTAVLMFASAPSREGEPTYEVLLSNIQKGYLEGNDVGSKYAEIIEKYFGLDGLERLYKDIEPDAKYDVRMQLFRDVWLHKRIEKLKKARAAAEIPYEMRTAVISEKAKAKIRELREKMEKIHSNDWTASDIFRKELIAAINNSGLAEAFWYNSNLLLLGLNLAKYSWPYEVQLVMLAPSPGYDLIKESVRLYKIHLMPLDSNFKDIVLRLISEVKNNRDLASNIHQIKIKPLLDKDLQRIDAEGIVPKIVIYSYGKELAQKALNIIYDTFKNEKGSGHCPPFNEKVTDLIYYTQGNRDEKLEVPQYYEQPDMVYFFPNVTGKHKDYHLINPAKRR